MTSNIDTKYRRIVSPIPHPESVALVEELSQIEPRSMASFSSVVWDRAEGFQVWDAHGNEWIDFTSAIILANAGHANPHVYEAIKRQLDAGLWHSYCNPTAIRLEAIKKLKEIAPTYLDKVFLLTTGSEAVECAIKLVRMHGRRIKPEKIHILSFLGSFHGRTMGAQTAGGFFDQRRWMGSPPAAFHHIPFPECPRCPWGRTEYDRCGAECFHRSVDNLLDEKGITAQDFAGVITETFQGPTVAFFPNDYIRATREWAAENGILLVFDEIQAGFGRTGTWFGFEHYGVEADLICTGKGMTSSLPMSAVIGRAEILDLPEHGEMSSTHTGNPISCAAVIGNIEAIQSGNLLGNAVRLEAAMQGIVQELRQKYAGYLKAVNGKGLAWSIVLGRPRSEEADIELAHRVTDRCVQKGLFMFQTDRGTLKIVPPLCIEEEAFVEGMTVIEEALQECINETAESVG